MPGMDELTKLPSNEYYKGIGGIYRDSDDAHVLEGASKDQAEAGAEAEVDDPPTETREELLGKLARQGKLFLVPGDTQGLIKAGEAELEEQRTTRMTDILSRADEMGVVRDRVLVKK